MTKKQLPKSTNNYQIGSKAKDDRLVVSCPDEKCCYAIKEAKQQTAKEIREWLFDEFEILFYNGSFYQKVFDKKFIKKQSK